MKHTASDGTRARVGRRWRRPRSRAAHEDDLQRSADHDAGGDVTKHDAADETSDDRLVDHWLSERPLDVVADKRS